MATAFPYKVVKTVEDSTALYTEVPSSWERDGILFWPVKDNTAASKAYLYKCIKEQTKPTKDWTGSDCVLKGSFMNLQSAKSAAKNLCNLDCTEDEER